MLADHNYARGQMPSEPLPTLEAMVAAEIAATFEPVTPMLARPQYREISDEKCRAILECWGSTVQRQGTILARLAILPWRKSELQSNMPGIVKRAPAWMDAHIHGAQKMTPDLFAQGIAETMATQRSAIKQVLADQMNEPTRLEALLADAPIPSNTEAMVRSDLFAALAQAMTAHTEVLVGIAADCDEKLRESFDGRS